MFKQAGDPIMDIVLLASVLAQSIVPLNQTSLHGLSEDVKQQKIHGTTRLLDSS